VWGDAGSRNVRFLHGTISDANTWAGPPHHLDNGAVLVWSDSADPRQTIDGVEMNDIQISDTSLHASRQVGTLVEPTSPNSPPPKDVTFRNFTIRRGPPTYLALNHTPTGVRRSNWRIKHRDGTTTPYRGDP
jgi:hypothetical protein